MRRGGVRREEVKVHQAGAPSHLAEGGDAVDVGQLVQEGDGFPGVRGEGVRVKR